LACADTVPRLFGSVPAVPPLEIQLNNATGWPTAVGSTCHCPGPRDASGCATRTVAPVRPGSKLQRVLSPMVLRSAENAFSAAKNNTQQQNMRMLILSDFQGTSISPISLQFAENFASDLGELRGSEKPHRTMSFRNKLENTRCGSQVCEPWTPEPEIGRGLDEIALIGLTSHCPLAEARRRR